MVCTISQLVPVGSREQQTSPQAHGAPVTQSRQVPSLPFPTDSAWLIPQAFLWNSGLQAASPGGHLCWGVLPGELMGSSSSHGGMVSFVFFGVTIFSQEECRGLMGWASPSNDGMVLRGKLRHREDQRCGQVAQPQ